jgi:Flp pilus assembly protein TadG
MRTRPPARARRGTIIPLLAVCLVALIAFVGLAVDLGMLMVARTECQNAADAAALTGARTLDNRVPPGTDPDAYDGNRPAAIANARALVTKNVFLNAPFDPSRVTSVEVGIYDYDPATGTFGPSFPKSKPAGRGWSCCRVWVNGDQPSYFSRILGLSTMPMAAYATATHRPRDIALVLDFSSSMRFGSLTQWETGSGNATGEAWGLMNPDPLYPQFGHYARYADPNRYQTTYPDKNARLGATGRPNPLQMRGFYVMPSGEVAAPNNHTVDGRNGPAAVKDFLFDPANLADPSVPVSAVAAANLRRGLHRWDPPQVSAGDPDNYLAPTYSYAGYNAFDTTNTAGPVPAPDHFRDQSDGPGGPYVGDRYPRKNGVVYNGPVSWDPATAAGAARTLAELLGVTSFTARTIPGSRPAIANGNRTEGGSSAADYRDDGWERNGYDLHVASYRALGYAFAPPAAAPFRGYSMGPGYWGKTFFIWPPDPRADKDWRRKFFRRSDGAAFDPQADNDPAAPGVQSINEALLNPSTGTTGVGAHVLNVSSKYRVDYAAVLAWLKSGPQVLPPNLRAGRVLYYSSIPNDVDLAAGNGAQQLDKRFWREYIDFVLGCGANTAGYDPRYTLAGVEYLPWPEGAAVSIGTTAAYTPPTPAGSPANPRPYMNYADNPNRPRMHFWFGPATMLAFLSTRTPLKNWWAGTTHEAQAWQLKAGIQSGLADIRANHPNDQAGLAYFAHPNFNTVRVPMGQDWDTLRNALFYPQTLLSGIKGGDTDTERRPYTAGFGSTLVGDLPNANGNTDPNAGLAMAYNLLSAAPGYTGRRGAAKVVIFETDGVPNAYQSLNFVADGPRSYYQFQGPGALVANGDAGVISQALDVVQQIAAPATAAAGSPAGFSRPGSPARVYALAFGDLFDPAVPAASFKGTALNFLLQVQQYGNTSGPDDAAIPPAQVITGPYRTRIDNLRTALERILQNGVQVTLIE